MMRRLLLVALRGYKLAISPLIPPSCRFYPSCSDYMAQAIVAHGAAWGVWLGLRRLARCHPWSLGGVDEVPAHRPRHPFARLADHSEGHAISADGCAHVHESNRTGDPLSNADATATATMSRIPEPSGLGSGS
jgi:uncharacterized protein